jgi:hypothetical protein
MGQGESTCTAPYHGDLLGEDGGAVDGHRRVGLSLPGGRLVTLNPKP